MLRLKNKDSGQAAVMFLLLIPIIIAFIGLAMDISLVFYNKAVLQDALDLSALAAVQETVKNHGQVESTAIEYGRKNGVNANELKVKHPYNNDNYKVQLIGTRTIELTFLPIIGIKTTTISATSVAEAYLENKTVYQEKGLDYAIFSGSVDVHLDIKGNSSIVNGNIHGNKNVNYQGTGHVLNGNLEVSGGKIGGENKVTVNGSKNLTSPVLPMPNLAFQDYASKANKTFQGDQIFNNVTIDGVWLINGNVKFNGGRIVGKGIILATGSIDFPGNNVQYSSSDDLLALYALGDITLSCTNNNINGVLYAPNGTIRINGSNNTFYGALIANSVQWATSDLTINGNYDIRVPQAFVVTEATFRLVE